MMDEGAPFCDKCKAYHVFPHQDIRNLLKGAPAGDTLVTTRGLIDALVGYHQISIAVALEFTPTKLILKHEDEDETTGGPAGPLFYSTEKFGETHPVVFDLTSPGVTREFGTAWLSYNAARRIAKMFNLPLEVF